MHMKELVANAQDRLHILARKGNSQSVLFDFDQRTKYVRPLQIAYTRQTVTAELDIHCDPKPFLEESCLEGADSCAK